MPKNSPFANPLTRMIRSALPPKKYIYGKLELGFFVAFLEKLIKLLDEQLSAAGNSERVIVKTQIHKHNAVEILGPRASIPHSLKVFLQQNIKL
jgi:hypothetical protein